MARDHYIPASVLGRFSKDTESRSRDRRLVVGRRNKIFETKAANFGFTNSLYDVSVSPVWSPSGAAGPTTIDGLIAGYESNLPAVLDLLEAGDRLPLRPWLRVLVPFVTAIFVRGNDFNLRFEDRPLIKFLKMGRDNTNGARFLELQRLLALVVCARWVVLHRSGGEPFIINDLGLMPTIDTNQRGYVIPISHKSALGIFPTSTRTVAWHDSGWHSVIEHQIVNATAVAGFNQKMAKCATEWIAGAERETIASNYHLLASTTAPDPAVIMEQWPFSYRTRVAHDREWHRLVSATDGNPLPDNLPNLQNINFESIASSWHPPFGLTINMTDMPTGLRRVGRGIRLTLKEPENYQDYFIKE